MLTTETAKDREADRCPGPGESSEETPRGTRGRRLMKLQQGAGQAHTLCHRSLSAPLRGSQDAPVLSAQGFTGLGNWGARVPTPRLQCITRREARGTF